MGQSFVDLSAQAVANLECALIEPHAHTLLFESAIKWTSDGVLILGSMRQKDIVTLRCASAMPSSTRGRCRNRSATDDSRRSHRRRRRRLVGLRANRAFDDLLAMDVVEV